MNGSHHKSLPREHRRPDTTAELNRHECFTLALSTESTRLCYIGARSQQDLGGAQSGVGVIFIDPGSPWQNAFVESFNGALRI